MNQYCNKLNFPINVTTDLTVYKTECRNHIRVSKDIMGDKLNEILLSVGVKLFWVEAFYLGKNSDHTIHCDGHELDNKAKLNYIVGGKNSVMTWYEPIDNNKIEKRLSKANTIYLGINTNDVVETFSKHMEGFYLVNVGKFHNVWNKEDDRYCLSACLIDSVTGYRLSFTELQNRLNEYINE